MLEIGSLVDGKYKILSEIGHGGMSVVYMAINEKANKTWAIKEVRKDGVLDFEAVKQGLIVETDMLKKLKHSHLPSIVDVIEDDHVFLIVMDYIEGKSLSSTLEEYGAQQQESVIEWAKQICDVLGYLHSRTPAIIYRDMKPANVMLKPDGNITLIDFGTAREFKERNLADTTCLGTVGYAAPEQFGGMGQTDARTDIYCLGATLYHLITGCNPSEPPYEMKPIREINPALSSGLEKIILKCTQRNPDDRYQSAAELMYALEHFEEIDDKYKKKQMRKLASFFVMLFLAFGFAVTGLGMRFTAKQKATDTYSNRLDEAKKTSDYDTKVKIYEECISIPNKEGDESAYLELIQAYKDNDAVFTVEEANQLERLIKGNRDALEHNMKGYIDICFETGKLFWYYYDYGDGNQLTRAKSALEWFQIVITNASDDYENLGMAKVYAGIGEFYRDIQTSIVEADDKGKYAPLFTNLEELLNSVAVNESESEIVRLELLELARSAIQQYATKFKLDGITKEQITDMYTQIEKLLTGMTVPTEDPSDPRTIKKQSCMALLEDTQSAIELAYKANGEGE